MRIVGIVLFVSTFWALTACSSGDTPSPPTPVEVSAPGGSYVEAVQSEDLDMLVDSFTDDAVIVDVGRRIEGRDQIREWAENEVIGGEIEVLRKTENEDGETLLVRFNPSGLSGGFEANYKFTYEDGRISLAELTYA
jgi:hypothetical protein